MVCFDHVQDTVGRGLKIVVDFTHARVGEPGVRLIKYSIAIHFLQTSTVSDLWETPSASFFWMSLPPITLYVWHTHMVHLAAYKRKKGLGWEEERDMWEGRETGGRVLIIQLILYYILCEINFCVKAFVGSDQLP